MVQRLQGKWRNTSVPWVLKDVPPKEVSLNMADKPSESRIRVALAQFCLAQSIEVDELLAALGVSTDAVDSQSFAHLAGVIDGMNLAANRIRQHGIDNWARDI